MFKSKTNKENEYIEQLKETISNLEKENNELKEKLESTTNKSLQKHIEILNDEISKVAETKEKLQILLKKENEFYKKLTKKYKTATDKAIKEFKEDIKI